MCENPSDLGRQDPRGCRFIYGDPGDGDWHFCQRTLVPGAIAGDAKHPPYCSRHIKVCVQPHKNFAAHMAFVAQFNAKFGVLAVDPERGDRQRLPLDVLLRLNPTGALSHD